MDWWVPVFAPIIVFVLSNLGASMLNCLGGKVGMCNLKENLDSLRSALVDLVKEKDIVKSRVNDDKVRKGGKTLPGVAMWLSEVQAIETKINLLVAAASGQDASAVHQQLSTPGCWSSTCFLGEEVYKKLNEVENLSSRGKNFGVVTEQAPPAVVEEREVQQTFGLDKMLENTWASLKRNRILGIYGMGGVGKTALLTLINNKFATVVNDYDVVIWVKVSKDVDIGNIQDIIGKRLDLHDEKWCTYSTTEKADKIGRVLTHMKPRFVLLLDDLWKEVSLSTIGIPLQAGEKKNKVVFTTRSKSVCGSMKADEYIEVECLAEEDALNLLKEIVRRSMLNGKMLEYAKDIVEKCSRLPLALVIVGKCLSSRTTEEEWRAALDTLGSCPDEMEGMAREMFGVLKLSYDYLENVHAKVCFQYCALFPQAYNIREDELVEYWIGEGILSETYGRKRAKDRGVEIINTLVGAGLLLKDGESKPKVCMHNMIHETALQIVSKITDGKRFLVQTDAGLRQLPNDTDWKTVIKMSLMNNQIDSIPDDPEFPDQARLVTLFLQNNKLVDIVGKFCLVMSTLVVMDLSRNIHITELPTEISMLVSLRLLNLSGTSIEDLPSGFGKLRKLIHLDLESTFNLRSISLISGLSKLQVLRFSSSGAALDGSLLTILERLKCLELLTITVRKEDVLRAFLQCNILAGCTQGLYLEGLNVSGASLAAIGELYNLSKLEMVNCDITESGIEWEGNTWFKNLSAVVLLSCKHLKDLTWLIYAANLKSLDVESSPKGSINKQRESCGCE